MEKPSLAYRPGPTALAARSRRTADEEADYVGALIERTARQRAATPDAGRARPRDYVIVAATIVFVVGPILVATLPGLARVVFFPFFEVFR